MDPQQQRPNVQGLLSKLRKPQGGLTPMGQGLVGLAYVVFHGT